MDFFKKFRKEEADAFSHIEHVKVLTAKDAMIKPVFLNPDDGADLIIEKYGLDANKLLEEKLTHIQDLKNKRDKMYEYTNHHI